MKAFTMIVKILAALAAVAGVVYLVATYGEKIVAWCKELLAKCPCAEVAEDEVVEEVPAEEPAAEEVVAEEPVAEEVPAEEAVVEDEPVADEADFAE